jgi:hypothetical protein
LYTTSSKTISSYSHEKIINILLLSCALLHLTNATLVFAADKKLPKIGFIKNQKLAADAIGEHCSLNDSPSARKSFVFVSNSDGAYMNLDGQDVKLQYISKRKTYRANGSDIRINIGIKNSNKSTFTISKGGLSKTIKARCWLND